MIAPALLACGASEHVNIPDDDKKTELRIEPEFNVCPTFTESLAIPQAIPPRMNTAHCLRATSGIRTS